MVHLTTRTLGKICDEVGGVIRTGPFGSQLHESDYQDEGVAVVMPKNIVDGKISLYDIARIGDQDVARLSQHKLHKGDIIYGRRGDIGRRALVTQREEGLLCGTGSLRISLGDSILNPGFLFYYLGQPQITAWISNQAIGATMPNLNTSIMRSIPVTYPPLPIQHKIASILSSYDDLIENNTRRIKILEEMARAIYREWFVHFRFPGHEKVKLVDSPLGKIPEGWEVATLGEHLVTLESGKRPKGGIRESLEGVPSIGAENINGIGRHDFASEKRVPRDFFEQMRKGVVHDRDVAIYKDGAYIGKSSFFRDGFPYSECCVNEHVFLLRASGVGLTQNTLYLWLQEPDTVAAIRATNANAAQPGINQKSLGGLELVLPDAESAAHFDRLVEPLLAEVINLAKHSLNLRQTRDLLLPKLVSGEIQITRNDKLGNFKGIDG